ncbi:hypothetical protein ACB092_07G078900 [Castanea dentata]
MPGLLIIAPTSSSSMLLKFTSTHQLPNLCFTSDTQTRFFLYSDKPTNCHSFLPLFEQTLTGDFLGCERKSTTNLMPLL